MKCILHIGTEKTGTTILQDWLYFNKGTLSENRVYLSDLIGKTNNRLLVCYFMDHFDDWFVANSINSQEDKERFFKDFKSNLIKEIEEASKNHDYMIITSEHFHSRLRKPELINQLKDFLYEVFEEVNVICYFREQSSVRKSLYSTALKVETNKKLEQFHNDIDPSHYYYNYYEIATRWSDIFGKKNCIFRVYERSRFINNDLREDFINSVGLASLSDKLSFDVSSANESLSYLESVLYRVINDQFPLFLTGGGVNSLNLALKKTVSSCETLKLGKIIATDSSDISKRFESINKKFFDTFFDGKYMFKPNESNDEANEDVAMSLTEAAVILEELFQRLCLDQQLKQLENRDADILRDVALKFESGDTISKQEARQLMLLALRARPNGGLIKRKVIEYSS